MHVVMVTVSDAKEHSGKTPSGCGAAGPHQDVPEPELSLMWRASAGRAARPHCTYPA